MIAMILAGGFGTRISEETINKPKPLVEIGGKPILEHLIISLKKQGINNFIINTGYKSDMIEEFIKNNQTFHSAKLEIQIFNSGVDSLTGTRIKLAFQILSNTHKSVLVTYGDGLGNINIKELLDVHKNQGKLVTVTAAHPPARFGYLEILENSVIKYSEKSSSESGWINAGYMIVDRSVTDFIPSANTSFESQILPQLADRNQLSAYKHHGFWKPMDTLRERIEFEKIYLENKNSQLPWELY